MPRIHGRPLEPLLHLPSPKLVRQHLSYLSGRDGSRFIESRLPDSVALAVACASHPRLGARSPMGAVPPFVLLAIIQMVASAPRGFGDGWQHRKYATAEGSSWWRPRPVFFCGMHRGTALGIPSWDWNDSVLLDAYPKCTTKWCGGKVAGGAVSVSVAAGRYCATVDRETGMLRVFDFERGRQSCAMPAAASSVCGLDCEGKSTVLTMGEQGCIGQWRIKGSTPARRSRHDGTLFPRMIGVGSNYHHYRAMCNALKPNGILITSGTRTYFAEVEQNLVSTGFTTPTTVKVKKGLVLRMRQQFQYGTDYMHPVCIAVSGTPQETTHTFLTGYNRGQVCLWDTGCTTKPVWECRFPETSTIHSLCTPAKSPTFGVCAAESFTLLDRRLNGPSARVLEIALPGFQGTSITTAPPQWHMKADFVVSLAPSTATPTAPNPPGGVMILDLRASSPAYTLDIGPTHSLAHLG